MLMLFSIAALIIQNLRMLFATGVGISRNCLCVQRLVIRYVVFLNICLARDIFRSSFFYLSVLVLVETLFTENIRSKLCAKVDFTLPQILGCQGGLLFVFV